jgi:STE24 endopeptidase
MVIDNIKMKKTMAATIWTYNFSIAVIIAGFVMLAILLAASLLIRPATGPEVLSHFSSSFLIKAADYNRSVMLISIAERFISWAAMLAIVALFWKNAHANMRIAIYWAILIFIAFNIILYMVMLPLQYWRGFVLGHRFGLSNQGLAAWFIDVLKDRAISLVINSGIMTLLYVLIIKIPKNWWIAAAAVLILFFILASFVYPIVIDPLFYKFTPLKDEVLQKEINAMTDKAGIKIDKILVADASRKTNTVNAYFTGIGSTKRIVIYDNLLNNHTRGEVLSVIAHEMGHWRYRHILYNTIIGCAEIILLVFILKIVQSGIGASAVIAPSQTGSGFPAVFGQPINFGVKLVALLFILYSFLSYLSMPLDNLISRQFEKQADKASASLTGDAATQIKIFENLAVTNLSNVKPGKVLEYIIFSHPPIIDRINAASHFTIP